MSKIIKFEDLQEGDFFHYYKNTKNGLRKVECEVIDVLSDNNLYVFLFNTKLKFVLHPKKDLVLYQDEDY